MMVPGTRPRQDIRTWLSKPDRLLVGMVAGAALFYLAGKVFGLGRTRPSEKGR